MLKSVMLIYNDQSAYLSKVEVVTYIQVHVLSSEIPIIHYCYKKRIQMYVSKIHPENFEIDIVHNCTLPNVQPELEWVRSNG